MNIPAAATHMIVLPGGGYAAHAPHEAEPVAGWLGEIGVQASVFRYPLNVRHPAPLDALRAEIGRRRAEGAQRIGLIRPPRRPKPNDVNVSYEGWSKGPPGCRPASATALAMPVTLALAGPGGGTWILDPATS